MIKILRRFRSAISGLFVSKQHAEQHPSTTVAETVKKPTVEDALEAKKRRERK